MYLQNEGYVYTKALDPLIHFITQKGEAKLKELEDMAQQMNNQHSEEKAEKAKDRRFQLINTLVGAVLGGMVTLLVEHFSGIVELVISLLRK